MTTFLSHEQPTVDAIRAHKYKNNAGGNTAVVEFEREHHNVTNFYIDDPDPARQLLAAAFEAVRILDPDGAADAVFALIEGDALAKIRARILEEDAAPEAAKAARIRKLIAEGQVLGIIEPDPADAAPDTAQPEDIPVPACRRCGATDTPLLIGGTCNSALCAERQVAKANVR